MILSSPLHCLHILSFKYDCRSRRSIPLRPLIGNFRVAQADSASCVWTPVAGSTKLSRWTTTWWWPTWLGRWRSRLLYAPQSSVYTTLPGWRHLSRIGKSDARSRLSTTWKNPREGLVSVLITPKTHESGARRPLLYCYEKIKKLYT